MVRVFVMEQNFPSDRRLGWGVDVSARVLRPAVPSLRSVPIIYMGGYDPKVIKNREKLHFFFRLPLFLLSTLGKTKGFRCKKRTAFLRTRRHFPISTSQFPAIFTLFFFVKSPSFSLKRWTFSKYLA